MLGYTPNNFVQTMSDSMPRDKFECILQNLNPCDNELLDKQDKFSKLFSVILVLNKRLLKFSFNGENKSIGTSVIPYYVTHGSRQWLNNKPIRVGYNIFVLAAGYDYVVQFESYQGVQKGNQAAPLLNGD